MQYSRRLTKLILIIIISINIYIVFLFLIGRFHTIFPGRIYIPIHLCPLYIYKQNNVYNLIAIYEMLRCTKNDVSSCLQYRYTYDIVGRIICVQIILYFAWSIFHQTSKNERSNPFKYYHSVVFNARHHLI